MEEYLPEIVAVWRFEVGHGQVNLHSVSKIEVLAQYNAKTKDSHCLAWALQCDIGRADWNVQESTTTRAIASYSQGFKTRPSALPFTLSYGEP